MTMHEITPDDGTLEELLTIAEPVTAFTVHRLTAVTTDEGGTPDSVSAEPDFGVVICTGDDNMIHAVFQRAHLERFIEIAQDSLNRDG